ncbi:hypothetical protein PG5_25490 [Pseudomonas sp. G5(2012)]|nr:hypothetical protein PG5_25490 [Pseudomonas sp. G5(2012)]
MRVASSCHEYWQSRGGSQRDNPSCGIMPAAWPICCVWGNCPISTVSVVESFNLRGLGQNFLSFDVRPLWR